MRKTNLMKPLSQVAAAALFFCVVAPAADPPKPARPVPDAALEWLRYGNERHVEGRYVHWHQSVERRREVAAQERPHAIVLTCSDSRLPPELVFDQGIGDLYVVRVAGNVAGEKELASIEYAAEQLGVPLVVVLGHKRCHVVQAAVRGGELTGHLGSIIASLSPAVERAKAMLGDAVDQTARVNVQMVVEQLRNSEPVLGRLSRSGQLKVTGAYYDLDYGEVTWLPAEKSRQH
jgi:carbonic anhydrase